ncbi:MAG TPA: bifunctional serine/threonine-protein kinase/ABC transporter substrate-binding protein [Candidatus Xenobia bacterium]
MLNPGDILERRYQIVKLLGAGGMSNIYLCRIVGDPGPERFWVIKEMSVHYADPSEQATAVELFLREGELLQRLDHKNLPKVIDRFFVNGKYHFVMEFVDGEDLGKLITRNPQGLPENMVLPWAVEVAQVLYYLHCQQPPIVFRDMKPSNIMISKGTVKLIDFGIARSFKPNKKKDTISIGSPGYAPPEQYSGQTDPRSDIYALGATVHHLLTGRDPTETRTPFKFEPVNVLKPSISEATAAIIAKATELDPSMRYQNALDMKKALSTVAGIHTRPTRTHTQAVAPGAPGVPSRGPTGTTSISPLPSPPAAVSPDDWAKAAGLVPPPFGAVPLLQAPDPPPTLPPVPVPAAMPAAAPAPAPRFRVTVTHKLVVCVVAAVGLRLGRDEIRHMIHPPPPPIQGPAVPTGPLAPGLTLLQLQSSPQAAASWFRGYLEDHPDEVDAGLWYQNAMAASLGTTVKVSLAPSVDPSRREEEARGALLALQDVNGEGGTGSHGFMQVVPGPASDAAATIGDSGATLSLNPSDTGPSVAPSLEAQWNGLGEHLTRQGSLLLLVPSDKPAPEALKTLEGFHVTVAPVPPMPEMASSTIVLDLTGAQLATAATAAQARAPKGGVWALDPTAPTPLPEGIYTLAEWAGTPDDAPGYAFALAYKSAFKRPPTVWAWRSWEAVHQMASALSNPGDVSADLKKFAPSNPSTWYVYRMEKGSWHLVEPAKEVGKAW